MIGANNYVLSGILISLDSYRQTNQKVKRLTLHKVHSAVLKLLEYANLKKTDIHGAPMKNPLEKSIILLCLHIYIHLYGM